MASIIARKLASSLINIVIRKHNQVGVWSAKLWLAIAYHILCSNHNIMGRGETSDGKAGAVEAFTPAPPNRPLQLLFLVLMIGPQIAVYLMTDSDKYVAARIPRAAGSEPCLCGSPFCADNPAPGPVQVRSGLHGGAGVLWVGLVDPELATLAQLRAIRRGFARRLR